MGVAAHLGIRLDDYDARIRTFIPRYVTMLDVAADAVATVSRRAPIVVDLGIGSGALAARCLSRRPSARVIGIDEDAGMLAMARQRLPPGLTTMTGSFLTTDLPHCDAIVASLALHHVATPALKAGLYRRCADALRPGGVIVSADCYLASNAPDRVRHREAWRRHLMRSYSRREASGFLRAWAKEDTYFELDREIELLHGAGFETNVPWRRDSFAVIVGRRASRSKTVAGRSQ
ncbi:MAG TPA: class I SAM-dependent methyltransferase [Vicinamibacterales bacterium]|nr:class I SAM-dependent methyltransferase [Vicinamibacterales bacterium]